MSLNLFQISSTKSRIFSKVALVLAFSVIERGHASMSDRKRRELSRQARIDILFTLKYARRMGDTSSENAAAIGRGLSNKKIWQQYPEILNQALIEVSDDWAGPGGFEKKYSKPEITNLVIANDAKQGKEFSYIYTDADSKSMTRVKNPITAKRNQKAQTHCSAARCSNPLGDERGSFEDRPFCKHCMKKWSCPQCKKTYQRCSSPNYAVRKKSRRRTYFCSAGCKAEYNAKLAESDLAAQVVQAQTDEVSNKSHGYCPLPKPARVPIGGSGSGNVTDINPHGTHEFPPKNKPKENMRKRTPPASEAMWSRTIFSRNGVEKLVYHRGDNGTIVPDFNEDTFLDSDNYVHDPHRGKPGAGTKPRTKKRTKGYRKKHNFM